MKLYHGSSKEITKWQEGRPVWLSPFIEDAKNAIVCQQLQDGITGEGFIYEIEIDLTSSIGITSDIIEFHGGTYFDTHKENVVKMVSDGEDQYWFAIRDMNLFNPKKTIL